MAHGERVSDLSAHAPHTKNVSGPHTKPAPGIGVLEYDANGDHVRCHICGDWFVSLAHHAWRAHEMTGAEYREAFGLNKRQPLMAPAERERRSEREQETGLLASYQDRTRLHDPNFPRSGNLGGLRLQHRLALERIRETDKFRSASRAAAKRPKPYMAEVNRKRSEPMREERACVICGTTFVIKRSHPKTCCSPECRLERRRQIMTTERAKEIGSLPKPRRNKRPR